MPSKIHRFCSFLILIPLAACSQATNTAKPSTPLPSPTIQLTNVTQTGFYWPTGTSDIGEYSGWLSDGCPWSGNNSYTEGYYHIGHDIEADEGSFVYAISDGQVIHISENGWGADNVGVLAEHKLEDGSSFVAVYGHVQTEKVRGDQLDAGVPFATIGAYDPPHLHFGIRPGTSITDPYGIMICPEVSPITDTNNFIDPIEWITTRIPGLFLFTETVPMATLTGTPTRTPPIPLPVPTPDPKICSEESQTGIIAFIRDGNIWIIRDDGTCEMQLTTEGDYSFPAISPDASKIAFIKHLIVNTDKDAYQIGQLDLQTLQEEVLVDVEPTLLVMAGTYYDYASPKWSPDGNFLYYHVGDGRVSGDELRKLNLETRQITLIGGPGFQVIAEGSLPIDVDRIQGHIAAVRNMQILGESLTIFDENGIFERDIIPPTQIFIGAICWTYDGESIIYAKDESRHRLNYSLEWIDQNGTELGTIIPEIHLNDSINYPINLACSPYDQRLIYQKDGSLYIVDYPNYSERFLVQGTQPSWGNPASIQDSLSPPSTLILDQQDVYSVIRYLVYLIMNKRSDLISPLIGNFGTSLHGAYGQEYQLPGFNNEGDVLAILDNSFQDASPSCLGIDVGTYEGQLLGYAHIFFQGLRCGFSERCSPNDDGSNIYNFLLRRNENNKWMLDYIGYDPESIKDLIEPLEQCPDVPMDPTINPIVIQNGASDICEYDSDFVADVTIPDNTQIAAGTKFTKTWRLLNSGTCDWTPDYSLLFISGDQMDGPSQMRLDRIVPAGESVDLSIDLFAPGRSGTYRGQWQLSLPSGEPFGTKPYVQIIVP